MEQILVTIDDTQPSASIRNAIKMLRGVVSASIIKESPLTIEGISIRQQANPQSQPFIPSL